jgi:ABC-type cobalamin transport system ATPase subunit
MQPSEALSATAQVAVTLAGFAGVVVAFRSGAVHEWSKVDKFRLYFLLNNSALPFLLSIFAMLLLTTNLNEQTTWRLCSLAAFVVAAAVGERLARSLRALSPGELKASGFRRSISVSSGVLAIAATLLQLYNVIRLQTFWPFFAIIATWLWLGMIQFVLLVTAQHESES